MGDLIKKTFGDVAQYDPERGLKTIAIAESAESYYARAKDLAGMLEAVTVKLTGQAEYVQWWDANKEGVGQPRKNRRAGQTILLAGKDGVPSRDILMRWRRIKDNLEKSITETVERCRQVCEGDKNVRGTQGTGENEWFTPEKYIELARSVLGEIDLDPASCEAAQKTVRAKKWFGRL
jgi:hypothetical protein